MLKLYVILLSMGLITVMAKSQCVQTDIVILDSTAIRNLQSTPIQVIPQPVAGHYIQVMGMEVNVTSQYTNSPLLIAYHLGSSEGAFFSVGLYSAEPFYTGWPPINGGEIVADAPVMLTVSDSAIGNGSATILITYRVVSLTNPTVCQSDTSSTSSSGGLCYEIVHVTNAQILNMFTTPVILLPAPGEHKYIKVLGADANMYAGTAFTGGTTMLMYYQDSTRVIGINTNALLAANDTVLHAIAVGNNEGKLKTNFPLRLTTQFSNPTTGTGDMDIIIVYKILDERQGSCSGGGLMDVVKDTIEDLTIDTVFLQANKTNLIVAQGTSTNIVFMFPAGVDNDVIQIIFTQDVSNAIPDGVGIGNLTIYRLLQLANDYEMTLRWKDGGWY